jgi:DNA-binding NtrC family response regulator
LPALRERKEDIPDLCESLCQRIADEMKIPARLLTTEALERLSTYSFPGNIRELRNMLERALILGRSTRLEAEDLYLPSSNLRELLNNFEKALIVRSLDHSHGIQAEAARKLGLSRSDLGYKVGRHGLSALAETPSIDNDSKGASNPDAA